MAMNTRNLQICCLEISDLFFQYWSKECTYNFASNRKLAGGTDQTWIRGRNRCWNRRVITAAGEIFQQRTFVSIKLVLQHAAYQHVPRIRGRW